ncbi:hypothetical protein F9K33_16240 [bacterium]|nr:MAG: hypothetical protein F9K33_16240 [bacterium]
MTANLFDRKFMKSIGVKPFNVDRYLKARLAQYFLLDSQDFFHRIQILNKSPRFSPNTFTPKTLVDTIMCVECALKSIIISLSRSNEKPENAYLAARRCGHIIDRLLTEASRRSFHRVSFLSKREIQILLQLKNIGVEGRYAYEIANKMQQEDPLLRFLREGAVTKLLNSEFLSSSLSVTKRLVGIAGKSFDKYWKGSTSFKLKHLDKIDNRLNIFRDNVSTNR